MAEKSSPSSLYPESVDCCLKFADTVQTEVQHLRNVRHSTEIQRQWDAIRRQLRDSPQAKISERIHPVLKAILEKEKLRVTTESCGHGPGQTITVISDS